MHSIVSHMYSSIVLPIFACGIDLPSSRLVGCKVLTVLMGMVIVSPPAPMHEFAKQPRKPTRDPLIPIVQSQPMLPFPLAAFTSLEISVRR